MEDIAKIHLPDLAGKRFLVLSRLEPADVILMREPGMKSRKIKVSSGGPYSHAAIVLNQFQYLESTIEDDYSGVQISFFQPSIFMRLGKEYSQLKDICRYGRYEIYRYSPDAESRVQFERFKQNLYSYMIAYFAKPYASGDLLLQTRAASLSRYNPLRLILSRARVAKVLAWCLSWYISKSRRPGIFCSMLVAKLFEDGGLRIFKNVLVMPHHFARVLTPVTDRIVITGEELATAKLAPITETIETQLPSLRMANKVIQRQEDTIDLINEINRDAIHRAQEHLDKFLIIRKKEDSS